MKYFDDLQVGDRFELGTYRFTAPDIKAFAARFDPQPMHLDEDAGRGSLLGGLAASGWHTCCLLMRMAADGFILNSSSMGAPGVDEVKWLKPLRPGTHITLRVNVLESRVSNSRPEMGFVKVRMEILDDERAPLMELSNSFMIGRRVAAEAAAS